MTETLAKFVDMDNIPKKYGGNLDWQFGDMPYLEPPIVDALRWNEQSSEKGHRTFPKGPIKWQYDEKGDLVAMAIGTENGRPRNRAIAGLHPDAGVARLALSPGRLQQGKTSAHIASAATAAGAAAGVSNNSPAGAATNAGIASTPNMASSAPATAGADDLQNASRSPNASAAQQSTGGADTYTVPYHNPEISVSSPPADSRQGTSSTRFEQQSGTHAEGQLAHGTPHTKTDGQGASMGVMEPGTVGQAPKEFPTPTPEKAEGEEGEGEAAGQSSAGVVGQAQQYATQAYEQVAERLPGVMAAVGLGGGKKEEAPVEAKGKVEDPAIDGMESGSVEEFLRSQTMSSKAQ